jgi:hypothetical protein
LHVLKLELMPELKPIFHPFWNNTLCLLLVYFKVEIIDYFVVGLLIINEFLELTLCISNLGGVITLISYTNSWHHWLGGLTQSNGNLGEVYHS